MNHLEFSQSLTVLKNRAWELAKLRAPNDLRAYYDGYILQTLQDIILRNATPEMKKYIDNLLKLNHPPNF